MKQYLFFSFFGLFLILNVDAQFSQPPPPPCGLGYVLSLCDGPEDDGFEVFDLNDAEVWYYCSIPNSGVNRTFYETEEDANAQVNAISNPETYTNISNPQNIYARIESGGAEDPVVREFPIQVYGQPTGNVVSDYLLCDDDNDGFAEFSLFLKDSDVDENNPCTSITYHASNADAEAGVNALPEDSYINIINPQTIYSREEGQTGNYIVSSFNLVVIPSPVANEPNPLEVCDDDSDGLAVFDLSVASTEIIGGNTNVEVTYHLNLTAANTMTGLLPTIYTNTTNPQTLYARVTDVINSCFVVTTLDLLVIDCTDTDSDGVIDEEEDRNSNGNLEDDDTDNDEIPNYLDDDDDGDNVDTLVELNMSSTRAMHPFIDTDNDLIENYLDDDDDGDGVLTKDEDYNNNGDPTDDDTNMNGIPDYLDSDVTLSNTDVSIGAFKLYPNPAADVLKIEVVGTSNEVDVEIYDIQGKMVVESKDQLQLNVSGLRSGLYFVKVNTANRTITQKLIIK